MERFQEPINPCFLQVEDSENGEIGTMNTYTRVEDSHPRLENNMGLMQTLQGMESSQLIPVPFSLIQQPSFQLLLKLQHQKLMMMNPLEIPQIQRASGEGTPNKERKKRKRSSMRKIKNKEEVEKQRITHIAVERNRRRLMNHHLKALISFIPPSYVQKGDQASIIGGAIDFVKELEQELQSLQAQKRMRESEEENCAVSASSSSNLVRNLLIESCCSPSSSFQFRNENGAEIEVVMIQKHVSLKVECQRKAGKLSNAIVELEALRLSVLHLNITSLTASVLYSFSLKIEDDCKLRSAEEVANAVHQIFTFINVS